MSDAMVRQAWRRYQETGGVEERRTWLQARVRSGEVGPCPCPGCEPVKDAGTCWEHDPCGATGHVGILYWIELAAFCDDEAAGLVLAEHDIVLPCEPPGGPCECWDPATWALGLHRWGREAQVRASMAAVKLVLPTWESEHHAATFRRDSRLLYLEGCPRRTSLGPDEILGLAQAWVDDPSLERARRCAAYMPEGIPTWADLGVLFMNPPSGFADHSNRVSRLLQDADIEARAQGQPSGLPLGVIKLAMAEWALRAG